MLGANVLLQLQWCRLVQQAARTPLDDGDDGLVASSHSSKPRLCGAGCALATVDCVCGPYTLY